jgi:hypothetical protein
LKKKLWFLCYYIGANHLATSNEIHIQSERLLQQLENWKFTVAACGDLFDKDTFLKEFLAFKMDIARGLIAELQGWEELGNETKRKNAIDNSEFFLGQIQVLINRVLADRYQETWQVMEEGLIFTDSIYES